MEIPENKRIPTGQEWRTFLRILPGITRYANKELDVPEQLEAATEAASFAEKLENELTRLGAPPGDPWSAEAKKREEMNAALADAEEKLKAALKSLQLWRRRTEFVEGLEAAQIKFVEKNGVTDSD